MVLTSIVASMISGIYVFVNQLMMVKLIPNSELSGISVEEIYHNTLSSTIGIKPAELSDVIKKNHFDISDIVRNVISVSEPMIIISFGTILLLSSGAGIAFSHALGSKKADEATRIWDSNIKVGMFVIVILTAILVGVSWVWTDIQLHYDPNKYGDKKIQSIFHDYYLTTLKWSREYIMTYLAAIPFLGFVIVITAIANNEGRLKFVVNATVICNVINIGLVAIFILAAKLGMLGAAIAMVISTVINFVIVLVYFVCLTIKNQTFIEIDYKFEKRINFKYPLSMLHLGLSSLVKYVAFSLILTFQQYYLVSIAKKDGGSNVNYYQSLLGAILPIFNLFLTGLNGVNRGTRTLSSYNFGHQNALRIKQTYDWSIIYGLIYCIFVILFFGIAIGPELLRLFDVDVGLTWKECYFNKSHIFYIATLILFLFYNISFAAFTILSTNRKVLLSCLSAIVQGIFGIGAICVIVAISQNIELFFFAPVIGSFLTTVVVIIGMVYYFKKLSFKDLPVEIAANKQ